MWCNSPKPLVLVSATGILCSVAYEYGSGVEWLNLIYAHSKTVPLRLFVFIAGASQDGNSGTQTAAFEACGVQGTATSEGGNEDLKTKCSGR